MEHLETATPACGSEADTLIIRSKELGTNKATALGRTNGGGLVGAARLLQRSWAAAEILLLTRSEVFSMPLLVVTLVVTLAEAPLLAVHVRWNKDSKEHN